MSASVTGVASGFHVTSRSCAEEGHRDLAGPVGELVRERELLLEHRDGGYRGRRVPGVAGGATDVG